MKAVFAILAVVSTALAAPAQLKRQFGNCCGNVCYSNAEIETAFSTGFNDFERGNEPGGYPHTYENFEGFDFTVRAPYQEFPILSSGRAYNGGSPGADRVIFNTAGQFAGLITHTGASGNDFVGCN